MAGEDENRCPYLHRTGDCFREPGYKYRPPTEREIRYCEANIRSCPWWCRKHPLPAEEREKAEEKEKGGMMLDEFIQENKSLWERLGRKTSMEYRPKIIFDPKLKGYLLREGLKEKVSDGFYSREEKLINAIIFLCEEAKRNQANRRELEGLHSLEPKDEAEAKEHKKHVELLEKEVNDFQLAYECLSKYPDQGKGAIDEKLKKLSTHLFLAIRNILSYGGIKELLHKCPECETLFFSKQWKRFCSLACKRKNIERRRNRNR
jgi:hypothetical protein